MAKSQIPNFEAAFEPFMAYGKMAAETAETAETAFKMQMDSAKAYAKVGMDNVTEGIKVTDFDQMAAYAEKQKEVAKKTSDMMIADAKAYADLGAKFFDSARGLMEDSVKSSMTAAKEATKAATGK